MLTKVLRLLIFYDLSILYACYVMCVKIVKQLPYETCRYLLILTAKNTITNELQYLSNKTNKQEYIY